MPLEDMGTARSVSYIELSGCLEVRGKQKGLTSSKEPCTTILQTIQGRGKHSYFSFPPFCLINAPIAMVFGDKNFSTRYKEHA